MYLTFLRAKNFESKVLSFLLKKAVCIKIISNIRIYNNNVCFSLVTPKQKTFISSRTRDLSKSMPSHYSSKTKSTGATQTNSTASPYERTVQVGRHKYNRKSMLLLLCVAGFR